MPVVPFAPALGFEHDPSVHISIPGMGATGAARGGARMLWKEVKRPCEAEGDERGPERRRKRRVRAFPLSPLTFCRSAFGRRCRSVMMLVLRSKSLVRLYVMSAARTRSTMQPMSLGGMVFHTRGRVRGIGWSGCGAVDIGLSRGDSDMADERRVRGRGCGGRGVERVTPCALSQACWCLLMPLKIFVQTSQVYGSSWGTADFRSAVDVALPLWVPRMW